MCLYWTIVVGCWGPCHMFQITSSIDEERQQQQNQHQNDEKKLSSRSRRSQPLFSPSTCQQCSHLHPHPPTHVSQPADLKGTMKKQGENTTRYKQRYFIQVHRSKTYCKCIFLLILSLSLSLSLSLHAQRGAYLDFPFDHHPNWHTMTNTAIATTKHNNVRITQQ